MGGALAVAKAILLTIGVATYLGFLQFEHNLATQQLANLQQMYASANAQAAAD
jgi:hypothetical protein